MGVTRRAADLPEFLEAVGEPETAAEIRRIRRATALGQQQPAPPEQSFQHRAPRRLARRPAATYSTQVSDDSEEDGDSEHGKATTDSGSSSSDSASSSDEEEEGSAAGPGGAPMADGKRAPGTDDERAERLARMMAAQCTLEPPEKVGLKTGWRPSASGFGVTAVSTNNRSNGWSRSQWSFKCW